MVMVLSWVRKAQCKGENLLKDTKLDKGCWVQDLVAFLTAMGKSRFIYSGKEEGEALITSLRGDGINS